MYNRLVNISLNDNLIVISEFLDGVVTSFDLKSMISKFPVFNDLLTNKQLYQSGHISPGGFGIIWNDEIDFAAESLYYDGTIIERKKVELNIQIAIMVSEKRIEKGVGQKELAKLTGIHQAEISKIERGIGNPSVKTLDRIAKGLGLNLKLFLE